MADRIRFRLCDGLTPEDADKIDTIVIAGMGGDTICGILDRAEFCMDPRYTLLLQPMTRAEVLRYWLIYNEFEIVDEDLVEDGGILYSVIVAVFGGKTRLNEAELYSGAYAKLKDQPLFPAFLDQQIGRFQKMVAGLKKSADCDASGRLPILLEILEQLEEMKDHEDA